MKAEKAKNTNPPAAATDPIPENPPEEVVEMTAGQARRAERRAARQND